MEKAACVHRGQDQKETWNGGWDRSRQGEEDEDSRDDVETFLSAESEFDVDSPPPPPTSSLEERDGVPSLAGGQLDVDEMSLTPFTKMYRTKVNDYRPAGKEVQLLIPNGREEVNKLNTMDEDCHIKVRHRMTQFPPSPPLPPKMQAKEILPNRTLLKVLWLTNRNRKHTIRA